MPRGLKISPQLCTVNVVGDRGVSIPDGSYLSLEKSKTEAEFRAMA